VACTVVEAGLELLGEPSALRGELAAATLIKERERTHATTHGCREEEEEREGEGERRVFRLCKHSTKKGMHRDGPGQHQRSGSLSVGRLVCCSVPLFPLSVCVASLRLLFARSPLVPMPPLCCLVDDVCSASLSCMRERERARPSTSRSNP
jgi:hypothetical protein